MLTRNRTPGDLAFWLHAALFGNAEGGRAETNERLGDGPWKHHLDGLVIHDRRDEIRGKLDARGKPQAPRPWSKIYGITWHQTASGHLDADHPRILSVPAHLMLHQDGSVTLLHPLVLRMEHGHALNGPTIGVEIDCREFGISGDRRTFWRSSKEKNGWTEKRKGKPDRYHPPKSVEELYRPVTSAQIEAIPKIADYIHGAHWHNAPVSHRIHFGNYVHLQGRHDRVTDPGDRIAQAVDRHRIRRLWKDTRNETYGSGKPWPEAWRAA